MTRQIPVWAMAAVLCAAAVTGAWGQVDPRGEHRELFVIRFEHVPAGSFMGVIEQLSRRGPGERAAEGLTVALHQESNAVVLLTSPEVAEKIVRLARELDQPSAFHERMRERHEAEKREGIRRWMEGGVGEKPGPFRELLQRWVIKPPKPAQPPCEECPMMGKVPAKPGRPEPKPGMPKPGAPKPGMPAPKPEMPAPKPEMPAPKPAPGMMLLSPEMIEKLHLRPDQVERMRQIMTEHRQQAMHLRERIANAQAGMPPQERAERGREMAEKAKQQMGEMMAKCHERILDVVGPDQREAVEKFFRSHMPMMMERMGKMEMKPGALPEQERMERRRMEEKERQLREDKQRREHEEQMRMDQEQQKRQERLRREREEQERLRREREGRGDALERDLLLGGMDL